MRRYNVNSIAMGKSVLMAFIMAQWRDINHHKPLDCLLTAESSFPLLGFSCLALKVNGKWRARPVKWERTRRRWWSLCFCCLCGPKDTPQIAQRLPYFLQWETRASLSVGNIWLLIASISVHQQQLGTPRTAKARGNKGVGNVWERGFEAEMDMNREAVLNNTAVCRHDKTGQRNCQEIMFCGEGWREFQVKEIQARRSEEEEKPKMCEMRQMKWKKVECMRAGAIESRMYDHAEQEKPHEAKRNDGDDTPGSLLEPQPAHHPAHSKCVLI